MLVALTRERGRNEELRHVIGDRAEVIEVPLTTTEFRAPHEFDEEIRALAHYGDFASLVVTSARCDRYVALAADALVDAPDVFSVGAATTVTLARTGLVVTRESSGTALDLVDDIVREPVLLLGATDGRAELNDELARRHLHPSQVGCYSTLAVILDEGERDRLRRADVVFIGAPSAWRVAREFVAPGAWVLVPGSTTLDAVRVDHARVLIGWGGDFVGAWSTVTSSTP